MRCDTLYLDTETYSERDLKKVGTYRYAENCEVMLITYALDDGPVQTWDFNDGKPVPEILRTQQFDKVKAWNAMFDRNVLRLGNLGIDIPIEKWECVMVQALSHALPGSLAEAGTLFGLSESQQKKASGHRLIQRFCRPAPGNHKADRYTQATHPVEWAQFRDYAEQDVVALREMAHRLPRWNWKAEDIAHWHLDQHINDRGFAVDLELARAGQLAAVREKQQLEARFAELTGGLAPTQRAKAQAFINDNWGLGIDSTAKHIMEPIAEDTMLPEDLREIAHIMLSANKSSTAKYGAVAAGVSADGRYRGGLQFAGAQRTRRWSGRGFQGQNLPSRGLPDPEEIEAYIAALKAGVHDLMFDNLMLFGSAALRGIVIAGE